MPRPPRPEVGLLVVGLGTLVAPLDTAVNIAFPSMTQAFELELGAIRWVVIAYVLTYASLMLVCGRLGDIVGYRLIFQLGLASSVLGLIGCAVAPSYALLLVGRMLQGIGAALILSCGPALATSLLEEEKRTRALAFYASVMAAGAALGPLVGGFLVAEWGWTAVFWFRVPLAMLALALSWLIAAVPSHSPTRGFDAPGAILLVVWMSALLLALAIPRGSFGAVVPLGLAVLGLLALIAFLAWEIRCSQPLIRLSLFRSPDFVIFNAASVAVNLAAFGVLLLVPYYLLRVAGLDVVTGGAVLALGAGGTVVGAWATNKLASRVPIGRLALAGVVLNIAGLWAVSGWTQASPLVVIGVSLLVQGLGAGLFQVGYTDYVTGTLPLADRGVAGSLAMVTRTIGIVLGATVLTEAFAYFETTVHASGAASADALLAGFQSTFRCTALGLAVCLAFSFLLARAWRVRT
jgi:MFS family permease